MSNNGALEVSQAQSKALATLLGEVPLASLSDEDYIHDYNLAKSLTDSPHNILLHTT